MPEVFGGPDFAGEVLHRFAEMNNPRADVPRGKKIYDYYLKKEVDLNPKIHEQGIVHVDNGMMEVLIQQ